MHSKPLDLPVAVIGLLAVLMLAGLNIYVDNVAFAKFLGDSNAIAVLRHSSGLILPLTVSGVVAISANIGKVVLAYHLFTRKARVSRAIKLMVTMIYLMVLFGSMVLSQLFFSDETIDKRMASVITEGTAHLDARKAQQAAQINARYDDQQARELSTLEIAFSARIAPLDATIREANDGMKEQLKTLPRERYRELENQRDTARSQRDQILQDFLSEKTKALERIATLRSQALAALEQDMADQYAQYTPEALSGSAKVQNAAMHNLAVVLTVITRGEPDDGELAVSPTLLAVLMTLLYTGIVEFTVIGILAVIFPTGTSRQTVQTVTVQPPFSGTVPFMGARPPGRHSGPEEAQWQRHDIASE